MNQHDTARCLNFYTQRLSTKEKRNAMGTLGTAKPVQS